MKKHVLIAFFLLSLLSVGRAFAQDSPRPVRTPEEEAMKQTEMLRRELELSQAQVDSIYQINLKYARLRQQPITRGELLANFNKKTQEILAQLTPAQQESFLNKQVEPEPHQHPRMKQ